MEILSTFSGFPQADLEFLATLAANNDRVWFEAHKNDYRVYLLEPTQAFVLTLGAQLRYPGNRASGKVCCSSIGPSFFQVGKRLGQDVENRVTAPTR